MNRREFFARVGGATVLPLAGSAQQRTMPVIGFLSAGSADGYAGRVASFRQGLSEAGYVEGQNVAVEYHWADGQNDRLPALAVDLVRRQVSVIVAGGGTATAKAAKTATATIPVIFVIGDPEQAGLVASLGRPGGNVTGVTELAETLITKRLELIRELVPKVEIVGFLLNATNPNVDIRVRDIHTAARLTATQVRILHATREGDLDSLFRERRPRSYRCAHRAERPSVQHSAGKTRGAGRAPCDAFGIRASRLCSGGRPDQLWG